MAAILRNIAAPAVIVLLAMAGLAPAPAPLSITAGPPTARPGDVVVLTIRGIGADEMLHVRAFDRDLPSFSISQGSRRALAGVDLEVRPGSYTITAQAGDRQAAHILRVVPRVFATRRLTVDPAFVNPPESERARIERERARLEELWGTWTDQKLWDGAFAPPVPERPNSAFGTRSILNGEPRSPHGGADFPSPAGTPIKAPNAGRIVLADTLYFTGNTVVLDHGLGLYSLFAHMTEMNVHPSDAVGTGDVLGTVGSTGRVTGPHLHWAVRLAGARVDPVSLIRATTK